jgi:hypothetical protein
MKPSALDGGEWSVSCPTPPGKEPSVPIVQESGWAPEPFWTPWNREKYIAPTENQTPAAQPVARRHTDLPIHTDPYIYKILSTINILIINNYGVRIMKYV